MFTESTPISPGVEQDSPKLIEAALLPALNVVAILCHPVLVEEVLAEMPIIVMEHTPPWWDSKL